MIDPKKLLQQLQKYQRFQSLTKAIKVVALSQLSALNKKILSRQEALVPISPFFSGDDYNDFSDYIIISVSVDKSCCGPHNNNVFNSARSITSELREKNKKLKLVSIGKRAKNFFKRVAKNYQVINIFNIDKEPLSLFVSNILSKKILDIGFDCCILLFNRFYTAFRQSTSYYNILSYDQFISKVFDLRSSTDVDVSSSYLRMLDSMCLNSVYPYFLSSLYEYFFSMCFLDSLEENEYSSLGARATVMNNATKNASELISSLRLRYNKARQEQITTELIDIVTASSVV